VMEEIGATHGSRRLPVHRRCWRPSALSRGGSAAKSPKNLPRIADGSLLAALAVDEAAKTPLSQDAGGAFPGTGFQLNGAKAVVVAGAHRRSLDCCRGGDSAGSPGLEREA